MPPLIEYGICSYTLGVCDAPIHPRKMNTRPSGAAIEPMTPSVAETAYRAALSIPRREAVPA